MFDATVFCQVAREIASEMAAEYDVRDKWDALGVKTLEEILIFPVTSHVVALSTFAGDYGMLQHVGTNVIERALERIGVDGTTINVLETTLVLQVPR